MVLLLLLLLVCAIDGGLASASCLNNEASILLRIKEDLHLSNGRLSSWDSNGSDCCMWEGVDCDPHTGHIIGLQLRGSPTTETIPHIIMDIDDVRVSFDAYDNFEKEGSVDPRDITGSRIPPALFELHQLQHLDLSGCDFNGSAIPPELTQLTHLTHLNLSRAWFSGQVPNELSIMSDLVSLDLSYISHFYFDVSLESWLFDYSFELELQDLEGFVQNFRHLKYLHLDYVRIGLSNSQKWSINLASVLPNLLSLSLVNCDLNGSLSPHIFKLPHLQALDLSYNMDLDGKLMPSSFTPESNLQSLRLAMTSLSGHLPSEVFELPLLKVLDLTSSTDLTGPLHIRLAKSKLQILKLFDIGLSGGIPDWIGNLTSLVELDLSCTDLSGSFPITIGNLRSLKSLDLSNTSLSGILPTTIGNLTALAYMDLSHTDLSGNLPITMANLTALTHLGLSGTNMSSSVPISIGSLRALNHLELSGCNFTGIDSSFFVNLTQLTYLDLSNNMISGSLPSLPQYLSTIHFRSNNFSGPIPNSYNFLKIKTLDLSSNSLIGIIPSNLIPGPSSVESSLQWFDLSNNKFDGYLDLGIFANFKKLYFLSLSGNNLTIDVHNPTLKFASLQHLKLASCNVNQFPQFLCHHKPIQTLDLSKNMITGEIPNWLNIAMSLNISHNMLSRIGQGVFLNIDDIDLSFNMLNGNLSVLFPGTSSFDNIDYFSISNNNVTGEVPASLCNFTSLSSLDLSNNKLSGAIPDCLFKFTSLVDVKLQNNQLQGQIPELSNCARNRLSIFDLSDNMLEGDIPTSLGCSKDVEFINLGYNKVSGGFPSWLGKLPKLKVLVLRSNFLSGAINFHFDQNAFQELLILDVSINKFTGRLPFGLLLSLNAMKTFNSKSSISREFVYGYAKEWEVTMDAKGINLTYLREMRSIMKIIDLSSNYFEGEISKEIGDLSGLQALQISRNKLKGPIPKSIGALTHLESLDLSHNYLSGEIPEEVIALNSLGYLNLSYNNLSGRIPQSQHFSTFDAPCFEGNPSLCGPPLSLPCEDNDSTTVFPPFGFRQTDEERMWKYISLGLGFGVDYEDL
ncbi:Receptor-like protein 12 [Nymphaea thermarum]|nr:Receptor-like protein 12 [Nymphaea thermarum]